PKRDFNGNDPFTFRVRTETAFSEERTITMIVQPVNDPPTLIVPTAQTVNLGERLSFLISAINPDAGELLSFSLIDDAGKPPGATITREPGDTSARFNWTPPAESVGKTYVARFRVKDNTAEELSDTKTVTITTGTLWAKTAGPEGGVVNSLVAVGANLFAGTFSGGVFRSPDQGNTWTVANNGLGELSVNAVFATGSALLAGTEAGGIYLSPDQGQNWTATNIRELRVFEFAANGNTLFAATDSLVRRSTDGGRTWTGTNLNLFDVEVVRTVLTKDGRVFAGTLDIFEAGLFVTSNDGQSWTPVRGGLPNNGQVGVTSLAATPTHLFALTGNFFGTAAVYASADNGQSWTIANTGLPGNVRKLSANGETAYALADNRIFASTDGGKTWAQINTAFTARSVRSLGFAANRLLAGTGGDGVFASTDGGRNFAEANQGFTNSGVAAFGFHDDRRQLFVATSRNVVVTANNGTSYQVANRALPIGLVNGTTTELGVRALAATGTELFAATQGGVFRALGRDAGWQAVNNGLANLNVSSLVLAGNRLFAGTGAGVFVSANQGQSWTAVNGGLTNLSVAALVLNGAQLLAGTGEGVFAFNDATQSWSRVGTLSFSVRVLAAGGRFIVAAGGTGIKVTEDGGGRWRDVIEGLPQSPTALVIRGTTAYGGISLGSFGDGIFALSAGAEQWRAVNDTLTNLAINALIVNGDNLFAGTNDGVSLSANTDQSWKPSGAELATLDINALWQQASGGGTDLFAAANSGSVFRSGNQGQSWQRRMLSAEAANVTALMGVGGALLAGTSGTGAFRSFDSGGNWAVVNAGLNNQQVRAFAGGTFVFAATAGGVYRSGNQGQSWERASDGLPTLQISSLLNAGETLWAGTDDRGVFLSRNNGQSWEAAGDVLSKFGIRSLGSFQGLLLAGTYRDGLYRSSTNGQSWLLAETDLPGVSSFAASGNKLYAGGVYGVYVSTDQGRSWRQINAGLTKTGVNSLTVIGDKLFAATSNGGVFVSQIPE
ncbi:MAG TPA: YCF48-related protein, partial [Blastocatellia bacterium]|nr:YCF48-related protein [Blastocatellia bacterium]